MHSTACGVGASATNLSTLQSSTGGVTGSGTSAGTGTGTAAGAADAHKMVHQSNNEDAMNKIPLKSAGGLDSDEEKNGGELMQDTAAAEEARREQMRANVLAWMKKLTIVLICFIGIALISYVIISLCFSDEQQQQQNEQATGSESIGNLNLLDTTTTSSEDSVPNVAASTAGTTVPPPHPELLDQIRIDTSDQFESVLGVYQHGAVSSDNLECSKVGSNILVRNGSAVDAAIAALLCNGLLTIQSLGIGGGFLMNIYNRADRHATSIDAREIAPYAVEPDMFAAEPEKSHKGPLSIAVPGEVMGYHEAHKHFGKLPWADLVAPSLELCEKGYHVSQHMERALHAALPQIKEHQQYKIYLNPKTGNPHSAGTVVKPPKNLCQSYKLLSDNGPLDFYNGTLAELLSEDLKDIGSIITTNDLLTYQSDVVNSITMDLGEDTLYVIPPVSSGSIVAHALSILQGYNLTKEDLATEELRARTIHRITEAVKFAFARRSQLGDAHYIDAREVVSQLTNPEFGNQNRAKINDSHVLPDPMSYGAQFADTEDPDGTSHLVVLAPNGDAVSVTSSINAYFGSGLIGPRTGIVLNNGMNDFAVTNNMYGLPQSQANTIEATKRPMSSQSPILLTDKSGDIRLILGAAGGSKIIPAVVEVVANVLWFGEDLRTAITAPRFYHQLLPDVLEYEDGGFSETLLQLLANRGHTLKPVSKLKGSIVTGIARNSTAIYANADYRKRGGVAGF